MGSLRKRHLEEMEVKEEEAGGCTNSLTLIDTRNGFSEISRLSMIWTVRH